VLLNLAGGTKDWAPFMAAGEDYMLLAVAELI